MIFVLAGLRQKESSVKRCGRKALFAPQQSIESHRGRQSVLQTPRTHGKCRFHFEQNGTVSCLEGFQANIDGGVRLEALKARYGPILFEMKTTLPVSPRSLQDRLTAAMGLYGLLGGK